MLHKLCWPRATNRFLKTIGAHNCIYHNRSTALYIIYFALNAAKKDTGNMTDTHTHVNQWQQPQNFLLPTPLHCSARPCWYYREHAKSLSIQTVPLRWRHAMHCRPCRPMYIGLAVTWCHVATCTLLFHCCEHGVRHRDWRLIVVVDCRHVG